MLDLSPCLPFLLLKVTTQLDDETFLSLNEQVHLLPTTTRPGHSTTKFLSIESKTIEHTANFRIFKYK